LHLFKFVFNYEKIKKANPFGKAFIVLYDIINLLDHKPPLQTFVCFEQQQQKMYVKKAFITD